MQPQLVANSITFIRIPLALLLVLCFQPRPILLGIAFVALLAAYVSDLADGFVARKLSTESLDGQLWDSLADKAIYIGAVVAMNYNGILHPVIAWLLILRDVGMYVTRIVYVNRLHQLGDLKHYSYGHCLLIYLTILAGFLEMWRLIVTGSFGSLLVVNALALSTFAVGATGSIKFILRK